jgi:hypothetical protein
VSSGNGVGDYGNNPRGTLGRVEGQIDQLLKTPTAQLAVNGGSQHPDKRREGGHGPTLADEIEFLPTPTARDHKGHNQRGDQTCLTGALLPTPRATDGTNGGPNQRGSSGDLMLPSAVMLLPTPAAMNPNDGEDFSTWEARRIRTQERVKNGNGYGMPLAIAVQLLPSGDNLSRPSDDGND